MTKKLKLLIPAGKATAAPPLGPAIGGLVNIGEFIKQFNEMTKEKAGMIMTCMLTAYDDRSFEFELKTSPISSLIKKELGIESGSGKNRQKKVGKLTLAQLESIAKEKLPDLNATSLEAAMQMVRGSARSMGVDVAE